jgi:hypothetical protein
VVNTDCRGIRLYLGVKRLRVIVIFICESSVIGKNKIQGI